jgi:peroxiredoxin
LTDYSEHAAGFEAAGVDLAALSVDAPAQSKGLRKQLGLSFPLLCDQRRKVIAQWGLFNRLEHGGIAYPATFLIDRDRTVRYSSAETLTSRVSAAEMLRYLSDRRRAPDAQGAAPRKSPVVIGPVSIARAIGNAMRYGGRSPKG